MHTVDPEKISSIRSTVPAPTHRHAMWSVPGPPPPPSSPPHPQVSTLLSRFIMPRESETECNWEEMGNGRGAKGATLGVTDGTGFRKSGLKNLRREVSTCDYEDVRIMWDMLNAPPEKTTTMKTTAKERKQREGRHVWDQLFHWSPRKADANSS